MAKTSVINIRTEAETKKLIEDLYSQFGISVSDAVNIFFRQSLLLGGLPFQMRVPYPNIDTITAIEDVNNNRNMSLCFKSVREVMKDLNA